MLLANESRTISFGFFTNNLVKSGSKLPFIIRLRNRDPKYNIEQALGLVMPSIVNTSTVAQGWDTPVNVMMTVPVANVDVDIPQGKMDRPHAIGLVIGNSEYNNLPAVKYAINDARVMKDYLVKTLGYAAHQVKYVENMKYPEFNRWFGNKKNNYRGDLYDLVELEKSVSQNIEVFIYYSGHGAPSLKNHRAYLIAKDTNLAYLESGEAYELNDFYNSIKALGLDDVTVVLDACFSGNYDSGPLYKGISPAALKTRSIKPSSLKNMTVITSASENEVSYWYPEARHSLFTYYFLKGIRGEADANKDHKITTNEIMNYVKYGVGRYTLDNKKASKQTPKLYGLKNRVLTRF